jgi:hypothetical protein
MDKLNANISLDLDNKWSYMKVHGEKGWEKFPSYFDIFIPKALEILDDLNLKITFFIIGQDASIKENQDLIKELTTKGHEVGNHSFKHEAWLHTYTEDELIREILDTEDIITKITGSKPIGFRGPGFSWSPELLKILKDNGYKYDATTLPTFVGPLLRFYYFRTAELSEEEKIKRKIVLGSYKDVFRPNNPFFWDLGRSESILEIPVTTLPYLRVPFHLNYLIYLSKFSTKLMKFYLNMAISFCKLSKTEPSFLLHPLDIISGDNVPDMSFFPGMDVASSKKVEIFNYVLQKLLDNFNCMPMNQYANEIEQRTTDLKFKQPALYT